MAEKSADLWKEHGALQYWEAAGDDVKPGKVTSFPQAVQAKEDESVVVSWIVYPTRAARDATMQKVMADPRMKDMMDASKGLFDGQRMFWGGFETIVQA
jgi:uncharacterized protein YbaA (DUF1428 family)